eukprot:4804924-Amphidinium_carterae.2
MPKRKAMPKCKARGRASMQQPRITPRRWLRLKSRSQSNDGLDAQDMEDAEDDPYYLPSLGHGARMRGELEC